MNNTQLLLAFEQGGLQRDDALKHIYENEKLRQSVSYLVTNNGGNIQDAEDVYQDTLILFDRQIRTGRFKGESTWTTYFIGIAKWRWISMKRKFGRDVELKIEHINEQVESVEVDTIENEKRALIDDVLAKIGERCKALLKLYKLSFSMEEIAQQLGLSSPEMAKKNAYECRKKFKDFVTENPAYKSLLNA
jgi:RNA polymerase sigma factor (sigma-70 family)